MVPTPVSGRGEVFSFTINHQMWSPAYPPPYVYAVVEMEGLQGLRFSTRLVDCDSDDVAIGLRVEVVFEPVEDVWLPHFRPAEDGR
jgi:uncharacterized OB-fold protein